MTFCTGLLGWLRLLIAGTDKLSLVPFGDGVECDRLLTQLVKGEDERWESAIGEECDDKLTGLLLLTSGYPTYGAGSGVADNEREDVGPEDEEQLGINDVWNRPESELKSINYKYN